MAAKAPIPSYQDMIESYQLMESDMNEQCSNETLEELAPKLTCWQLDPLHLGRATVGRIERSSDSEEQRQKNYLIRWSKQSGLDATYESLARYFLESGLTALAEDVCRGCGRAVGEYIKCPPGICPVTLGKCPSIVLLSKQFTQQQSVWSSFLSSAGPQRVRARATETIYLDCELFLHVCVSVCIIQYCKTSTIYWCRREIFVQKIIYDRKHFRGRGWHVME